MTDEDEHLAYGGDEISDEKTSHESPPQTQPEITDSTAQMEEVKAQQIIDACRRRDLEGLQALAESPGGFIRDELRQQAWPILLGLPVRFPSDDNDKVSGTSHDQVRLTASEYDDSSWKHLQPHKEEEQVRLDVARAFVYYPQYESDQERAQQKQELSDLILSVLRRHPYLCYFQGYHDICQVLLLVLPRHLRAPAAARLSALRIRDFMLPTLAAAISQLRLIPEVLRAADPALAAHLPLGSDPFFALSGTITMYAHDVRSRREITRLFDALLAAEPALSLYLFAQLVIRRRAELLAIPAGEPDVLHAALSRLPHPLGADALVAGARALLAAHPPESLPSWPRRVSPHSVLKTARSLRACAGQSLAVGEYLFGLQVAELRREERRQEVIKTLWRYRRPARAVGVAVAFAVLAYWVRRSAVSGGVAAGPVRYMTALVSAWWEGF
ncbi:hypothetical protein KVR01_002622 [Diaporthe batatas]|uniref:GTPase-activating protein GYP8 n=1 Tax=Diaporthe batatas TaxID=748121 RepID=UPI001D045DD3|nr:GTPase-activating protein GYP8 [Diaporthe batatas]KAG8166933.1 hypothetical protein KVR01_002622 [Diaporthe batatas]